MDIITPFAGHRGGHREARLAGRTGTAAFVALSVLATAGVVLATPGVAWAAPAPGTTVLRGQIAQAVLSGSSSTVDGNVGPVLAARHIMARATQSTLTLDKASVQSGQSIVFSGHLTAGASASPLANQAVRLEENSSGKWKTVDAALANADGSVTFTVKPAASAKFRLSYAGIRSLGASVSTEQAVTVKVPAPVVVRSATTTVSSSSSSGGWAPAGVSSFGANHRAASATAQAVVAAAASQAGKPYVYAAAGPNAYDCSGLTMWAYAQVGISLPHNADAQRGYGSSVAPQDAAPGDLILFLDGGYAYHVGIYAGGGQMWDAPNSSTPVGLHTIWSTNVVFRHLV